MTKLTSVTLPHVVDQWKEIYLSKGYSTNKWEGALARCKIECMDNQFRNLSDALGDELNRMEKSVDQ